MATEPNALATVGDQTPEPLICSDLSVSHFHERSSCIQCHRVYCPHYASEIDNNFCRVCLTESQATIHTQPLKDVEGIAHEGKWMFPTGSIYKTLPRAISEMSDSEAETYFVYMKEQIKNAETTLQYRRIAGSVVELEIEHRKVLESRRLRGIKLPNLGTGAIKIGASGANAKVTSAEKLKQFGDTLKALGITKEVLEAILASKKKP